MLYGTRIRFYRESRGMTQEELAQQVGIVASSISKVESGARKVTLEEAVRFADVLQISLHDLAGLPTFAAQHEEVKTLVHQCAQKVQEADTAVHAASSLMNNLERILALS